MLAGMQPSGRCLLTCAKPWAQAPVLCEKKKIETLIFTLTWYLNYLAIPLMPLQFYTFKYKLHVLANSFPDLQPHLPTIKTCMCSWEPVIATINTHCFPPCGGEWQCQPPSCLESNLAANSSFSLHIWVLQPVSSIHTACLMSSTPLHLGITAHQFYSHSRFDVFHPALHVSAQLVLTPTLPTSATVYHLSPALPLHLVLSKQLVNWTCSINIC